MADNFDFGLGRDGSRAVGHARMDGLGVARREQLPGLLRHELAELHHRDELRFGADADCRAAAHRPLVLCGDGVGHK